jgi:hypothetical protein
MKTTSGTAENKLQFEYSPLRVLHFLSLLVFTQTLRDLKAAAVNVSVPVVFDHVNREWYHTCSGIWTTWERLRVNRWFMACQVGVYWPLITYLTILLFYLTYVLFIQHPSLDLAVTARCSNV